ncbi:MAG: UDP-2,4-diacetamido-2,4,6-trideoxy-beta-L-altropyranose hydrolase [Elusimicrobia bacterium]|nr:UDP-2,4-diacetamido-2,4,6-trideoxy-beta-L-altropyranose hydrolase [Elusimicrobiota bacterium]
MSTDLLILRADADARIATGHVMRSLALAQAWKAAGGTAVLLSDCRAPNLEERAASAGVELRKLESRHPDASDLASTLAAVEELADGGDAWVALDGYHFDEAYQKALREAGCRVLVVDDYKHLPRYDADILLNQNPGSEAFAYAAAPDTLALLGFSYALLRSEFTGRDRAPRSTPDVARKLLITFGGADPGDMSSKAVEALDRVGIPGLEATAVAGAAYPHFEALQAKAAASQSKVEVVRNVPDMPERMERAEAAIATAGSTITELAYMGVPSVFVSLADNQGSGAQAMERNGLGYFAGDASAVTVESLAKLIGKLCADAAFRRRASERGRALVDGKGAARVVNAMRALDALSLEDAVELKPATLDDALPVWRLANEPGVRAVSFFKDAIPLERHLEWYPAQLARQDSRYWLLSLDGVLAAQVRYCREEADTAEVHFSVPAAFRGKGLGTLALKRTAPLACKELGVKRIVGRVLGDNEASSKAFLKAGYSRAADGVVHGAPCRVFELVKTTVPS